MSWKTSCAGIAAVVSLAIPAGPAHAIGPGPIACFNNCHLTYHLCLTTHLGADLGVGGVAQALCLPTLNACLEGCSSDLRGLLDAAGVAPVGAGGGGATGNGLPTDLAVDLFRDVELASWHLGLGLDGALDAYDRGIAHLAAVVQTLDDGPPTDAAAAVRGALFAAKTRVDLLEGVQLRDCYAGTALGVVDPPALPAEPAGLSSTDGGVVLPPTTRLPRAAQGRMGAAAKAFATGDAAYAQHVDQAVRVLFAAANDLEAAARDGRVDRDLAGSVIGEIERVADALVDLAPMRACFLAQGGTR